jgi:outer membrane protein assembly factor BamD
MSGRKVVSGTLLAVVFFIFLMSGCALWSKQEPEHTPKAMYEHAMALFQKKKYQKAAEAFKKFKEEFPLSEYTPLVELRTADALYFDKKYAEAIGLYEEFKKLHPLHNEIPYVIYQVGMCHFQQILSLDRDQTETEKAIEQFRYLTENFPQSPHAANAQDRLKTCQKQMLDHEYYIGYFYFRTKKYKAALERFEGILQKYPGTTLEKKITDLKEKCQVELAKKEKSQKDLENKKEKEKIHLHG